MFEKKMERSEKSDIFRKRLLSELNEYRDRVDRARREVAADADRDDIVGIATRNANRELLMGNLERYLLTIVEIEKALQLMETGQYATCVVCWERIPDKRLQAIPWTRICVHCAGGRSQFGALGLGLSSKHA